MKHVLNNPNNCTGCGSCLATCNKQAITLSEDHEGFLHPSISSSLCNDCGTCTTRCPVNFQDENLKLFPTPISVFAGWHLDQSIRLQSSSGGVFSALASHILAQGGYIVGAAFDSNLYLRHEIIRNNADLGILRGSKYVQSEISRQLLVDVRNALKAGISILFSGTPCQVSGLRNFLGKDYPNLFCIDIICHGIPSPKLWKTTISSHQKSNGIISNISFRDKTSGWKNFRIKLEYKSHKVKFLHPFKLPHLTGFWFNYALRPSCYECKFSQTSRTGDITLGDFWKVERAYPQYDKDNKGTSLVLVNSVKGQEVLSGLSNVFLGKADLQSAVNGNKNLERPTVKPAERGLFFKDFASMKFNRFIIKYELDRSEPPSLRRKFRRKLASLKKKIPSIRTIFTRVKI